MNVHSTILSAIGHTPLVRLNKLVGPNDATVLREVRVHEPGRRRSRTGWRCTSSRRPRREGKLKPGGTIVENTCGNTGMGVAMAAAVKGYRCIFTMPDKMSKEKINRLKALGAQVVVTPTNVAADSPQSYYETAKRIAPRDAGQLLPEPVPQPRQHRGALPHHRARDLGAAGGQARRLRRRPRHRRHDERRGQVPEGEEPGDPERRRRPDGLASTRGTSRPGSSPQPHVYKVEGIGEDMLCEAMDFTVLDEIRQVDDQQCFTAARRLAREEGLFGGGCSGAAVHVAVELAQELGKGKMMVGRAARQRQQLHHASSIRRVDEGQRLRWTRSRPAGWRTSSARASSDVLFARRRASASTRSSSRCGSTASARCRCVDGARRHRGDDPRVRPAERPGRRRSTGSTT